jgi:hypothetical protein
LLHRNGLNSNLAGADAKCLTQQRFSRLLPGDVGKRWRFIRTALALPNTHWQIPTTHPYKVMHCCGMSQGRKAMLKDLLKKERQKLWLVSGLSATESPVFARADASRSKTDGWTGEHDRRSLELSERWPRLSDVLTIARASSGI